MINPGVRNARGYATGCVVEPHDNVEPLMHPRDYRRTGFIAQPLWVAAYHPEERFVAAPP